MDPKFKQPILFIIFNRPETTRKVFDRIKEAKPQKLFIAADGPRDEKEGEKELCEETRKIVADIDWPCEVKTLFRKENLGCKSAVSGAINWFFDNVDQGIILEDDCLPNKSFFTFCEQMLDKYKDDKKVMMVTGTNYLNLLEINKDYFFSQYFSIWGWATWKRAWKMYDINMSGWPKYKEQKRLGGIFKSPITAKFYEIMFDQVQNNMVSTWDIQWAYTCLFNEGLSCTPKYNLIKNIGQSGTHINTDNPKGLNLLMDTRDLELSNSENIKPIPDYSLDKIQFKNLHIKRKVFDYYLYAPLIPLARKIRSLRNYKNITKSILYGVILRIPLRKNRSTQNKLLIIKLDAIGDYILFRNFLEEVRKSEKYRDYKITLCGNELWRNLFENFDKDFVDDVIWVSPIKFRKNPFYIYKIIRKIKKAGFDIAINPMYSKTLQTDVLMKASGATEKYQWGEKFFTLSDKYQFEFNINKEFFEKLLNKKIEIKSPNFVNIPQLDLKLPEKFAVIFTGASDPKRRWGLKNFSQIAKIINQRYDYKIVLVGGEKEELDTETINMTGKTSLTELVNIISKAKILISNDSSPVHVAIATKTPAICISNGNTFGRFTSCPNDIFDKIEYVYPDTVDDHSFKENFDRFYFGSTVNINEITPEKVLPVIEKILK